MTKAVVDLAEPVEIHDQKPEWQSEPPRRTDRLVEPVEEQRTVGKTGELVVESLLAQGLFRLPAVGDVGEARDDLADAAVVVLHRHGIDEQPAHIPVSARETHHHVPDGLAVTLRRDVRHLFVGHDAAVLAQAPLAARWRSARELLRRPAKDAVRRRVREDHRPVGITHHDAAGHGVVDPGEIASLSRHPSRGHVLSHDRDVRTLPNASVPQSTGGYRLNGQEVLEADAGAAGQ